VTTQNGVLAVPTGQDPAKQSHRSTPPADKRSRFKIQHAPQPADHFKIISNDFLRGKFPVPLKALERVLLLYFVSLPNGWRMDRDQLDQSVMEGRDAVSKALAGLERKGYLRRSKGKGAKGTWSWSWHVTVDPINKPLPQPESQSTDATSGNNGKQQVSPSTGNPATETQAILEDGREKTDQEDGYGTSGEGASRGGLTATRPRPRPDILRGEHLGGYPKTALTKKLVSVWTAVVRQERGAVPVAESGGWGQTASPSPAVSIRSVGRSRTSWASTTSLPSKPIPGG
jgi:hypothetical protein